MTPPSGTPDPRRPVGLVLRGTGTAGISVVSIEVLARDADLHPELVQRLIALGALDPHDLAAEHRRIPSDAAARLARIARLRHDLGLNYAGALLADELLTRIDALEDLLSRHRPVTHPGGE